MNPNHRANREHWNRWADNYNRLREADGILPQLADHPELGFDAGAYGLLWKHLKTVHQRKACVLGSGDNYCALALAAIGMDVTSVDISERQLYHAEKRAQQLNLRIRFVCSDATDLRSVADQSFDLACSTNGFFVWIDDLPALYREVARILRPGGIALCYDVHPFQRPWKDDPQQLIMEKSYFDVVPRRTQSDDGTQAFERHWTVSDIVNAVAGSGLTIIEILERPASSPSFWKGPSYEVSQEISLLDWHVNPRAGLPVWLTTVSRKPEVERSQDDV